MSAVDHPSHYNRARTLDADGTAKYEPIKVIEYLQLGFCLGNAVKYILRAPHKGREREDLEKALWYLDRDSDRPVQPPDDAMDYMHEVAVDWEMSAELTDVLYFIAKNKVRQAEMALRAHLAS